MQRMGPYLPAQAYRAFRDCAGSHEDHFASAAFKLGNLCRPIHDRTGIEADPRRRRQGRANFNNPAFCSRQYFRALHCRALLLHGHSIIPALMDARINRAQQLGTPFTGRAGDGEYRAFPAERARQFRNIARAILRRQ